MKEEIWQHKIDKRKKKRRENEGEGGYEKERGRGEEDVKKRREKEGERENALASPWEVGAYVLCSSRKKIKNTSKPVSTF